MTLDPEVVDEATARRPAVPSPEELREARQRTDAILAELDRLLLGRSEFHHLVLTGILSRGHLLLEGVPGVGKTALIKALGSVLGLEFNRVQFTPDLMPADIVGSHLLEEGDDGRRQMRFQPGPVFTQILLADEINRASPKTQSALLEAMQERSVTLLGTTRELPRPFVVLASQNPIELEGTYPLPEAQLDRFLFKLEVEAPSSEVLEAIVRGRRRGEPPSPRRVVDGAGLDTLFDLMDRIALPTAVARYIARLVAATHGGDGAPESFARTVRFGASPRAAIALAEAARARALLAGRPSVGFEDVAAVTLPVLRHRLILDYTARFDGVTPEGLVDELLTAVEPVDLSLPAGVSVASEGR